MARYGRGIPPRAKIYNGQFLDVPIVDDDAGSATETESLAVTLSDSDLVSGVETETIAVSDSDTGSGTDSESVSVPVSDSDTGSGTETESVAVTLSDSDTGSGTEGQSIAATLSDADTGAGTETESIAATLSDSDTGSGVDAGSVSTDTTPNSSDTGSGTETESIAATLSDSDTGSGTETATISISDSDTGSGIEGQTIALSDSDTGSAVETESLSATLSDSDTGSGFDTGATDAAAPAAPHNYVRSLVMGPATVYIGDFGATEPADTLVTTAPSAVLWRDLGGTLGGVTLTIKQEFETISVMQLPDRIATRLKKEQLQVTANLAEPALDNFLFIMNEGAVASGAGFKSFTPSATIDEATPLTYRAVIVDGWAPELDVNGRQKRRRVIMRKCLSIEGTTMEYDKEKQTSQSILWSAHRVDGIIPPFKIIDEV